METGLEGGAVVVHESTNPNIWFTKIMITIPRSYHMARYLK